MNKFLHYTLVVIATSAWLTVTLLSFYLAVILSNAELVEVFTRAFGSCNAGGARPTAIVLFSLLALTDIVALCMMVPAPETEEKVKPETDCYNCRHCKVVRSDGDFYCSVHGTMRSKATYCSRMKARENHDTENT
jgi:hypothetical protein